MQYNEKYDRYVTKGGLVYRYSKSQDKLILCKSYKDGSGYRQLKVSKPKVASISVHRLVYETFVGEIPQGYQIDHINTIRTDNSLENLRCVTHAENNKNPLTRKHRSEARKGKTYSDFGDKFKEHFGITYYDDSKLYKKEHLWYLKHNHICRWEKEA